MPDTSIHILFFGVGLGSLVLGYPKANGGFEIIDDSPYFFCSKTGIRKAIKHAQWMGFNPIIYKGKAVKVPNA